MFRVNHFRNVFVDSVGNCQQSIITIHSSWHPHTAERTHKAERILAKLVLEASREMARLCNATVLSTTRIEQAEAEVQIESGWAPLPTSECDCEPCKTLPSHLTRVK